MLDKLDSQGEFFIEKIKAALLQKIRKRYILWKYYLADRVIFYHASKYLFSELAQLFCWSFIKVGSINKPCDYKNMAIICSTASRNLCNIIDVWTGKAWYSWNIRVFLLVQSDCCHFREHEHSPTTWNIRSIDGFLLLCLMSSTFKPRLSQISLNMPTDKVDSLFTFTKLQMLRERVTVGHIRILGIGLELAWDGG